jgi:hypothetical protein
MHERFGWKPLAATIAAALVFWGCGDSGAGENGAVVSELQVVATEVSDGAYAYDVPERVAPGATRVTLRNDGREPHHGQLFKLAEGATVDDLAAALASGDPAAALEVGTFEGGTGLVAADKTSRADAVVDLSEGTYVLICFVEDPSGVPHLAHGMLQPFEVGSSDDRPPVPEPAARVELADYAIDLPETLAGDALLEITNASEVEPHEMIVSRLDARATLADVLDALAAGTPPPATPLGGVQALLPGASQSLQLDLEPGRYVVSCQIPSVLDQAPHHTKGMIAEVTVT